LSEERSESERQTAIQQIMMELLGDITDPNLTPEERHESAESLRRHIENRQVEALYETAKKSQDPEIRDNRDNLVRLFMDAHAETLFEQNGPHSIGSPKQFLTWLSKSKQL
jgi:hypothetical protein